MKIGVLTSSRADFGIYTPLLQILEKDPAFDLHIIAFGTHLSEKHGKTINEIEQFGYKNIHSVKTDVTDDTPLQVSRSYAHAVTKFTDFWNEHHYELVLTLGDRYEMNAAIQASIPFRVKLAHFHGGEQTLGAIDNIYRHQISLASQYHFTAADAFSNRLKEILENTSNIYTVGSMSLVGIEDGTKISEEEFRTKYDLGKNPFVLSTFHPETNDFEANGHYVNEMKTILKGIDSTFNIVVTMPNADTNGALYRDALKDLQNELGDRLTLIESFGKINYFAALTYCDFVLGNSSSGIIEAASFKKYVINVGDRQKGRLRSSNVIDVPFNAPQTLEAIEKLVASDRNFLGRNEYVKENTIGTVIDILRKIGNGEI
ncbi:MAG: UDP-N-acetylglucosamine 2-epimerase [Crocinitomicaceae bacterium]